MTDDTTPFKITNIIWYLNSREKFEPVPGFEPRTSRSLSLVLYHLSYPGSVDGTGLNLPLESNSMQAFWSVTLSVII